MALQAVIGGVPITDYTGDTIGPFDENQILFGAADTTIEQSQYLQWDDKVLQVRDNDSDFNLFIGQDSGMATHSGAQAFKYNIAIGSRALYGLSGTQPIRNNVVIGNYTLANSVFNYADTGSKNVAIGAYAGYNNEQTGRSVIIGYQAGFSGNTEGPDTDNVFIGHQAGFQVSGRQNVCIGSYTGYNPVNDDTGFVLSTFIGNQVANNGPGNNNQSIGIGYLIFQSASFSGDGNVAIGGRSMEDVTSGARNVAVGLSSGNGLTTGSYNVFVGDRAGENVNGSRNVMIGREANEKGGSANDNIAIGYRAMEGTGTTSGNGRNIAIGVESLGNLSSGFDNIAIGDQAGQTITTQDRIIAIGDGAAAVGPGRATIAIGGQACYTGGGEKQIVIGVGAGTGADGNNNVIIGFGAGSTLSSGASNVIIGYNVEPSSATASSELRIHNGIYGGNPRPLIEGDFLNRWVRFNTETRISHDTNSDEGFIARTVLTDNIDVSVSTDSSIALPAGTRVLGVSFWVISGGGVVTSSATNTWGAELTGGSTTTLLADTTPGALNTKREILIPDEIMSAVTEVRLVAPGAETFVSGSINIHVYYEYLNPLG